MLQSRVVFFRGTKLSLQVSLSGVVLECPRFIGNFTQFTGQPSPTNLRPQEATDIQGNLMKHSHVSRDNVDRSIPSGVRISEYSLVPTCRELRRTSQGLKDASPVNFSAQRKIQGAVILSITKNSCKSLPKSFETRNPSSAIQLLLFKLERSPTI